MSLDMTTFEAALKEHYTNERIRNMVYPKNPLLTMISKKEDAGGKYIPVPIKYGLPQGRSVTFATAQANKTNSQLKSFFIERVKDYSLASIDNETIEASKGNSNAFMEAATFEIDGAYEAATRSIASALYGNGSGSIGQVTAGGTGTSITLTNVNDVVNFEVGMEIVFSDADGGSSVRSGNITVTAVNRDTGVLTVDAMSAIAGGAGTTTNDYIFIQGDYDGKIKGLRAWLPDSAPSATSFFNVDRSVDPTRLAGIRYDASAQSIEEGLIDAAARLAREGAAPDYCFMNPIKFAELEKALGSKVQYIDKKISAEIGFRGIGIHGQNGLITVLADHNCPSKRAFMLDISTWKLLSLGSVPRVLDQDGIKMLRESSADALEVRVGYYAQLACFAPGFNANIKLES